MLPDINGSLKSHSGANGTNENDNATQFLDGIDVNDLPTSVFVCDVPNEVFTDSALKAEFEDLFVRLSPTNFIYLQNFRRVRVHFGSPVDATQARIALHEYNFRGQIIKIFFAQVKTDTDPETSDSLLPPQPEKLFLISPPASPPVGWEPIAESEPVIDYSLLSAIATLGPGASHEIHQGTGSTPSVIVHTCEENELSIEQPRLKIQQTRRPDLSG